MIKVTLCIGLLVFSNFSFACKEKQFTTEPCVLLSKQESISSVHKQLISNSDKGNASASYLIGVMYLHGLYLPQDFKKAFSFFKKSAELDFRDAQVALGLMLTDGDIPVDIDKSLYWLLKGAKNGHIVGKYNYAYLILDEVGKGDEKLAFEYMLEAETWGYEKANFYIAQSYANGIGVTTSDSMSLKYLKKGASKNEKLSLFALGFAYFSGHLVKKDTEKGLFLIKKASLLGEPLALHFLKTNSLQ